MMGLNGWPVSSDHMERETSQLYIYCRICDEPQLRLKMMVNRSAFWDLQIVLLNVFIPVGECVLCINTFSTETLLAAVSAQHETNQIFRPRCLRQGHQQEYL